MTQPQQPSDAMLEEVWDRACDREFPGYAEQRWVDGWLIGVADAIQLIRDLMFDALTNSERSHEWNSDRPLDQDVENDINQALEEMEGDDGE